MVSGTSQHRSIRRRIKQWKSDLLRPFFSSNRYWQQRYRKQRNSGVGSYGVMAEFKAEVINEFLASHNVASAIEYGCGDGAQLTMCDYPRYLGFDVSPDALEMCRERFPNSETRQFRLVQDYSGERADLTLSLDVIYHLVETSVYEDYLARLFDSSDRLVLVYSTNEDLPVRGGVRHGRHRRFTDWVEANRPEWLLQKHIPNRYPPGSHPEGSDADFFAFEKAAA